MKYMRPVLAALALMVTVGTYIALAQRVSSATPDELLRHQRGQG